MAVEIANSLHCMCAFIAANPPVIIRGEGVSAVTRSLAGNFTLVLDEKLESTGGPPPDVEAGVNVTLNGVGNGAYAMGVITSTGDINVLVSNQAGALTDTGLVYVEAKRFPNRS